jgi:predicted DNA-binding ribbon-helix-helix protein
MRSVVLKRSVVIAGHKTSVSLEEQFWSALKEAAKHRNMTPSELIGEINAERGHGNLSSAIRLFVLGLYRDQIENISYAKTAQREETNWSSGLDRRLAECWIRQVHAIPNGGS